MVTAVIALLVAVLLPALSRARWQSRHLLCQSNLGSIAKAWQVYLVNSGGWFLKSVKAKDNYHINYGGRQGVSSAYRGPKPLNRVLGLPLVTGSQAELFRCPFDAGGGSIRPTAFAHYGSSYLMNHLLVGQPKLVVAPSDPCREVLTALSGRIARISTAQLSAESRLLLVGDYGWFNAREPAMSAEYHMDWHGRRMQHNAAFMDGHTAFVRIHKGLWQTDQYTLIPFAAQQQAITGCQVHLTDACCAP